MMRAEGKFYMSKILSLLTRPHGPWMFLERPPEWVKEAESLYRETWNYVTEFAEKIGMNAEERQAVVRDSRKKASYMDRWIYEPLDTGDGDHSRRIEYLRKIGKLRRIRIKNPIDPRLSLDLPKDIKVNGLRSFYSSLNCLLRERFSGTSVDSIRRAYLDLYSIYELMWVRRGLPVGPYNPYLPIYTTFDHGYASATAVNLIYGGSGGKAFLLDVAGVHNFISKSRKLRDLWASSYLVSYMLWRTVEEVLLDLGPDVLLKPTARFNPFFIQSLLMSPDSSDKELVERELEGLIEFYGIKERGFPFYATLPESALLLLPSWAKYDANYFITKFARTWEGIYEAVSDPSLWTGEDVVSRFMRRMADRLRKVSKLGFSSKPPLSLRVVEVDITELLEELGDEERDLLLWKLLFEELSKRISKEKLVRRDPESELDLASLTKRAISYTLLRKGDGAKETPESLFSTRKGFNYCTVCGRLPSMLNFPVQEERYREYVGRIGNVNPEKALSLQKIFSAGEKLCPWCLTKRMFSVSPQAVLKRVNFLLPEKEPERLNFPSLSEISSVDFLLKTIERLTEEKEKEEGRSGLSELLKDIPGPWNVKFAWRFKDVLSRKYSSDEQIQKLLIMNPEDHYMGPEADQWRREIGEAPQTYVAIVKSDGDNLGSVLSGRLQEDPPGIHIREWIKAATESFLKKVTLSILSGKSVDAETLLEEVTPPNQSGAGSNKGAEDELKKMIQDWEKTVKDMLDMSELLPSLSYGVTISAALMRNALLDVSVIEMMRGFVVYAGGEDVLAILPVRDTLKAVIESRKTFFPVVDRDELAMNIYDDPKIETMADTVEKSSGLPGFYSVAAEAMDLDGDLVAVYPHLAPLGRSYSVYLTHVRYPLSLALTKVEENLERVKEEESIRWTFGGKEMRKDAIMFVFSARGGEQEASLPLSLCRPLWKESRVFADHIYRINEVVESIREGRSPLSPLYKLKEDPLLELLLSERKYNLLSKYLKKELEDLPQHSMDLLINELLGFERNDGRHSVMEAMEVMRIMLSALGGEYR